MFLTRSKRSLIRPSIKVKLWLILAVCLSQAAFSEIDSESLGESYKDLLDPLVQDGFLPAYYLAVGNDERLLFERGLGTRGALNHRDPNDSTPFALFSLSKPIVALAVLKILEEKKINLDSPLSTYLTDFKQQKLLGKKSGYHEIRLIDLFTHSSGLANNLEFAGQVSNPAFGSLVGRNELSRKYQEQNLFTWESILTEKTELNSLSDQIETLSSFPLLFEPGTEFQYSLSTDVLGRLAEVLSGKTLNNFLRDALLSPLEMENTAFVLDEDQRELRATVMKPLIRTFPVPGTYQRFEVLPFKNFGVEGIGDRANILSGGMGLISTGGDLVKFLRFLSSDMMLSSGEPYLTEEFKRFVFENQLGDRLGANPLQGKLPRSSGDGFSALFNIRGLDRKYRSSFERESIDFFYWSGFSSSVIWIDPASGIFGVFLSQIRPTQQYLVNKLEEIVDKQFLRKTSELEHAN